MTLPKELYNYHSIFFSERDKVERFERLIQTYLQTDPYYKSIFKEVWMWNEFPAKLDLGGSDNDIDLEVLTRDNDYWVIQSKCFKEGAYIDKAEVDSFYLYRLGNSKINNYKLLVFHRSYEFQIQIVE